MADRNAWRAVWGLLAVAALGSHPVSAAELRMLNWADYIAPEVIDKFRAETGHTITVTTYSSFEEMWELMRKPGGFDLVLASEYDVPQMVHEGLLAKTDPSALTGFGNIEDSWRQQYYDEGNEYSIPWHWGTTSFVVDTKALALVAPGREVDTLALLFEPPAGAKIGMIDDGEEVIPLAMRYLGLPYCSTRPDDMARVETLVVGLADAIVAYDVDEPVDWLVEMTALVSLAWNGDALRAREQRPALRYVYPRQGVGVWTDVLVVQRDAANREAAKQFLSFMLRPENAALQSNYTGYANAIRGSEPLLAEALRTAPEVIIPPAVKLEFLRDCDAATYGRYRQVWSKVRQAQRQRSGTGN